MSDYLMTVVFTWISLLGLVVDLKVWKIDCVLYDVMFGLETLRYMYNIKRYPSKS